VNIVTASGVGQDSSGAQVTVTATDTNRVVVNPISVACSVQVLLTNGAAAPQPPTCLLPGVPYIVRTIVINTGQFDLQNVQVTSTGPDQLCNLPATIGNLAINERRTNDCTFVCDASSTRTYAVSVTGVASQTTTYGVVCDHNIFGQQLVATNQNPCTASVCCRGIPHICVTKEVVCELPTGCDTPNFSHFALAAKTADDSQCPSFCYRIRVTNCGADEDLRNVTVVDNVLDLSACNFPTTLAIGQTAECILAGIVHCNDVTNTVTATGVGVFSGIQVTTNDHAAVQIKPIDLVCDVTVNGQPFISIPCDGQPHPVENAVRICNTGELPLADITIYAPDIVALGGDCTNIANLRLALLPGECTNLVLCTDLVTCPPSCGIALSNHIRVTGTVDVTRTAACSWTRNQSNQVVAITAETECEAQVGCVQPNACRTTGGGRQDDPLVYPANVRYVTHGGQVGAPVGNKVCTVLEQFYLGNPCIHGRWTHVRHEQGGLRGNFHARYYDTLDCACLDTNTSPATVVVPGVDGAADQTYVNLVYGPGTLTDGVCNKDDHKVAGPQPRPAPANKMVFTGVGDWADPNGRRAPRATLFRVDLEDRSEPGGSHPKGSVWPPDRYRIRIWVLNDNELAQLRGSGPDKYLIHFRDCIAACNGIDYQDGGVCGPNTCSGDSCTGAGATGTITFPGGCPVRTPTIDDGGELERGNHQIHPSIMDCDPANPVGPGLAKP
jgi:hypothetical protein